MRSLEPLLTKTLILLNQGPTLMTSLCQPHLQIQSHRGLGLQYRNFGDMTQSTTHIAVVVQSLIHV